MTTPLLRKKVATLAKQYAVKVAYKDLGDVAGETDGRGGCNMVLNETLNNETELLSAFYHELGHIHCTRTDTWKDYHDPVLFHGCGKYCDWKECWKVERWVDRWAEREAKKNSPELCPFFKAYYEEPRATIKRTIETALPNTCQKKKQKKNP